MPEISLDTTGGSKAPTLNLAIEDRTIEDPTIEDRTIEDPARLITEPASRPR
jgi:hypothetical protein